MSRRRKMMTPPLAKNVVWANFSIAAHVSMSMLILVFFEQKPSPKVSNNSLVLNPMLGFIEN